MTESFGPIFGVSNTDGDEEVRMIWLLLMLGH